MTYPSSIEPFYDKKGKKKWHFWHICLRCGKGRWVVTGCYRASIKKGNWTGLCKKCVRNKSVFKEGEEHPGWKGGRFKTSNGYVQIILPEKHWLASMRQKNGYIREHRYNMACKLGRPLASKEIVHHINGIRDDNRPENLMIFNRAEHIEETANLIRRIGELEKEVALLKERLK